MDLGVSQRQLARRLGVSKRSVELWERDEVGPGRELMLLVTGFLGYEAERSAESVVSELAAYRRANRLTLAELSRRLGVHATVVARWESGQRVPKRPMTRRVKEFLQIARAQQVGSPRLYDGAAPRCSRSRRP